ncbi:MAG: 1-acyl-sn-glycerol-3-phosphate acyltransferase, partial [Clostridia bacterium]
MKNETEKEKLNKKATMENETEKENLNKKAMKSKAKSTKVDISRKWYFAFVTVSIIWRAFIHGHGVQTEAFKQQKKKGASLIIANHLTAFDFIYYAPNFVGRKTNMVVAENMKFSRPIFAKLMDGYHVITKKQNFADFQCIKNIKRYLDAGISVFICPEGKVSAEGRTGLIGDSIARLIQWLGYPVTTVINSGSGLMRPKWVYNNRKVRVTTNCDVLFTAEQTKTLSKAEIYQKVKCALDHNEHEYQAQNKIVVHGKRYAEGLERLLYKCPKCGAEFAMKTSNDKLFCEACGNAVRYMPTGELAPIGNDDVSMGRIDYWCDMERGEVAEEVKNKDFCISNR